MFTRRFALALTLVVASAGIASAQTPTRIQQFKAWGAYTYKSGNSNVCYVLSVPTTKEPANVDHGDIFFIVSQRPGQKPPGACASAAFNRAMPVRRGR